MEVFEAMQQVLSHQHPPELALHMEKVFQLILEHIRKPSLCVSYRNIASINLETGCTAIQMWIAQRIAMLTAQCSLKSSLHCMYHSSSYCALCVCMML